MACCCGLCVPSMIIMKANAKENLGEFICLSITKANAKTNLQIFICNHFCVDGITCCFSSCCIRCQMENEDVGELAMSLSQSGLKIGQKVAKSSWCWLNVWMKRHQAAIQVGIFVPRAGHKQNCQRIPGQFLKMSVYVFCCF